MMHRTALLIAVLFASTGCNNNPPGATTMRRTSSTSGDQSRPRATARTDAERMEAERAETERMDRERMDRERMEAQAPTAMDQSEAPEDLEITRQIRAAVVGDSSLSIPARNVTIVTHDAVVTLRGNVDSNMERDAIAHHAQHVAGVERVDNMISVGPQPE
jgi:osmotically-inducible protein OsmY